MPNTSVFFSFIVIFTVFTLIVGAGLSFYQKTLVVEPSHKSLGTDTISVMIRQGTVVAVSLMFAASALLFLAASIRFVTTNRD